MKSGSHTIHIKKQSLKFSAAHMTVFPDGKKEALHGHDYQLEVTISLESVTLPHMVCFSEFKSVLKAICEKWDEKVLLAEKNPFFQIKANSARGIDFILCKKRYLLPREEVELLPLDNIVCETLAEECCRLLLKGLKPRILQKVTGIDVRVDESPGQGATYSWLNVSAAEKEIQSS